MILQPLVLNQSVPTCDRQTDGRTDSLDRWTPSIAKSRSGIHVAWLFLMIPTKLMRVNDFSKAFNDRAYLFMLVFTELLGNNRPNY